MRESCGCSTAAARASRRPARRFSGAFGKIRVIGSVNCGGSVQPIQLKWSNSPNRNGPTLPTGLELPDGRRRAGVRMRRVPKLPEDGYLPRVADASLERALKGSGAVYITGPKWCGKTATAERHSRSQVYLQDPDRHASLLALAEVKPSLILEGEEPRLIDEWQEAPQLWDAVRFAVDRGRGRGRFILTGSASPLMKKDLKMKNMSNLRRLEAEFSLI